MTIPKIPANPTLTELERYVRDKGHVPMALTSDLSACQPLRLDENGNLQTVSGNGTPAFINVTATPTPTALPANPGTQVAIKNLSGGNMTIGRSGSAATWTLPDETERTFVVKANSSELLVSVPSGSYNVDAEVWG